MSRLRPLVGRLGLAATAGIMLVAAGAPASAQGLFDFLNQAFGGGGEARASVEPMPQPFYDGGDRPLTVRRSQKRRHPQANLASGGRDRYNVADLKGITIYTDKTLMPGDAVMTATGIRVFAGSSSWPYRDGDFVAIASSVDTSKTIRKQLTAMDNASRLALRPN